MQDELKISKRTFFSSMFILFTFMMLAGIFSCFLPSGRYNRILQGGREVVEPDSFTWGKASSYPVWRWFTAPVEVLWGPDSKIVSGIILFLLLIGGSFALILRSKVLDIMIVQIKNRYYQQRYFLLAILTLASMLLGAFLGVYEEILAVIPILVALSHSMGWDTLTGLGISLLACCFGFGSSLFNPFSLGVAQSLAGLPLFSGLGYRMILFVVLYAILLFFLIRYAKKIEARPEASLLYTQKNRKNFSLEIPAKTHQTKSLYLWCCFCISMICSVVLCSPFLPIIQQYSFLMIAFLFLLLGVGTSILVKLSLKEIGKEFSKGVLGFAPGIVLILMAMSVKHIIANAGIMDTLLYYASGFLPKTNPIIAVFSLYGITLFMSFFIGSASAKAFLIVPILVPLSELTGITRQAAVSAFCLGDGFTNLLYPTNTVLLIALGLTDVPYLVWVKWTFWLQTVTIMVSLLFLTIVTQIGYGPF